MCFSITKKFYFLYSIIFVYNIIIIHSIEIINDDDTNIVYNIQNDRQKLDSDKESLNHFIQSSIYTFKNGKTMSKEADKHMTRILTDSNACNNISQVALSNGTCVSISYARTFAITQLRNDSTNTNDIIDTLSLYYSTTFHAHRSQNDTLKLDEVNTITDNLKNITVQKSTKSSFIMVQQPNQDDNIIVIGAAFYHETGGQVIHVSNRDNVINSDLSVAAIVNSESLIHTASFNILIIYKPFEYTNTNHFNDKTIVSSVIVVSIRRNSSGYNPIHISLYFKILDEYRPNMNGIYLCSFYDTHTSKWNEDGCTVPQYNQKYDRYECSCNHLTTFALVWSPILTLERCYNRTHTTLFNGICITKDEAKKSAASILINKTTDSNIVSNALSIYIDAITNYNLSSNPKDTLTISEIDAIVANLHGSNISISLNSSFIMVQSLRQGNNKLVLGASFQHQIGGQVVNTANINNMINSDISAAAIISSDSLSDVVSLNMLIIDEPSLYDDADKSTNKRLASSVIVVSIRRNSSGYNPIHISLYFKILDEYRPNMNGIYLCSFYDIHTSKWNEGGCTVPQYNQIYDRYECSCNHLTTFALTWLPNTPQTNYLTAQDIASLIFLSISILCFIAVIIHSITIRFLNPIMSPRARDSLPLISSASTTILFIFYIALAMIVFTQTTSQNERRCFLSSSVLMFFVYFFLIFMFCIKTSVGYFNYLRFVHLFPEPSHRKLFLLLIISFFISITWTSFAVGLNSNSSYNITQLHGNKLCWFTRDVIYYFLAIPVCIFLLLNFITIFLLTKHIINYARDNKHRQQPYERMKRCVIIILLSCITQGIGWLFVSFGSFVNSTAGDIFGWIFIVFNGLEGIWTILLYITLRSGRITKAKDEHADEEITKATAPSSDENQYNY